MASVYETRTALNEYLFFHYGDPQAGMPGKLDLQIDNFPRQCVKDCIDTEKLPNRETRALDLGCAVGRGSFELSRICTEVVGIDLSASFIEAAQAIQKDRKVEFPVVEEGRVVSTHLYSLPNDIEPSRVQFMCGDAHDLPDTIGTFDVVLMINLIDRLGDPYKVLTNLTNLLKPGGQLVIASPYTWLSEFTPSENWLGGFYREGEAVRTLDTLRRILESDFAMRSVIDLPFLIREHVRKYQLGISQATCWIKL